MLQTKLTMIEPCSFCDGNNKGLQLLELMGNFYIECKYCQSQGQFAKTKHDAVNNWNNEQEKKEEAKHDSLH